MRKVRAFNFITLSGYIEGPKNDITWHGHDLEQNAYAIEMLKGGDTLLFGRATYELMASYWPTPFALNNDPVVAEAMNSADKIVFSRTLRKVKWSNTRLVRGDMVEEIRKMKEMSGKTMTLLGSGSIVTQLAQESLIDEYQIMVDPVVLGKGTPIFKGLKRRMNLKLTSTRTFRNGTVLLCYQPMER